MRRLPRPQPVGLHTPKTTLLANKGSRQARLPSRAALNMLTKGDPSQQTMGNFAKLTPSGAGALGLPYSDITQLGQQPSVVPALTDDE